jgi:hypothetical protein
MMMLLYATDPVFKSMPKFNMPLIRQLFGSLLPAAGPGSVILHLYIDTMTKFQYKLLSIFGCKRLKTQTTGVDAVCSGAKAGDRMPRLTM